MDDSRQIAVRILEFTSDVVGLAKDVRVGSLSAGQDKLTLSQPSKAHSPAYSATAKSEISVFVPSNQPWVFHSSLACPLAERPVTATTMPVTVTPMRATNLKNIRRSPMRVAILVEMQLKRVTARSPPKATPLLIHGLTCTTSAPTNARTTYSPKIIAIIAADPGFNTSTAHHVKRNPVNSPNILER